MQDKEQRALRMSPFQTETPTAKTTTKDISVYSTFTPTPLRLGAGIWRPALLRAVPARLLGLGAGALSLSSEQQLSATLRGSSSSSTTLLWPFVISSSASSDCCGWDGGESSTHHKGQHWQGSLNLAQAYQHVTPVYRFNKHTGACTAVLHQENETTQ